LDLMNKDIIETMKKRIKNIEEGLCPIDIQIKLFGKLVEWDPSRKSSKILISNMRIFHTSTGHAIITAKNPIQQNSNWSFRIESCCGAYHINLGIYDLSKGYDTNLPHSTETFGYSWTSGVSMTTGGISRVELNCSYGASGDIIGFIFRDGYLIFLKQGTEVGKVAVNTPSKFYPAVNLVCSGDVITILS